MTENICLVGQKNTNEAILNQQEAGMAQDGGDDHGLQITNLEILCLF